MNLEDLNIIAADEELEPVEVEEEPDLDAVAAEEEAEEEIDTPEIEHFDDAIKLYMRDIQKSKLLSAEEEKELAGRIDLGDKAARDKMIESNLRLVVDQGGGEIQAFQGMPFFNVRNMVDKAEHRTGTGQSIAHHQIAGACF